jgi:hypothetical protein
MVDYARVPALCQGISENLFSHVGCQNHARPLDGIECTVTVIP